MSGSTIDVPAGHLGEVTCIGDGTGASALVALVVDAAPVGSADELVAWRVDCGLVGVLFFLGPLEQ